MFVNPAAASKIQPFLKQYISEGSIVYPRSKYNGVDLNKSIPTKIFGRTCCATQMFEIKKKTPIFKNLSVIDFKLRCKGIENKIFEGGRLC